MQLNVSICFDPPGFSEPPGIVLACILEEYTEALREEVVS